MHCPRDGEKMKVKKGNWQYRESGLDDVVIVGINIYYCPVCDEVMPEIPRINELHRLIAEDLMNKKSLLTGKEIRFLRKEMYASVAHFAKKLGISKAQLRSWESGEQQVDPTADRLIRVLYSSDKKSDLQDIIIRFEHISKRIRPEKITISSEQLVAA